MRAAQIVSLDGPSAIQVGEIDDPSPEAGTIVVDVHAAGVAFPDALLSRGLYQYKPELPFAPGSEVAGVVRSAPEGLGFAAGDRVMGLTGFAGGMAEIATLAPIFTVPLPDNFSFVQGAGLLFNDFTAHFALTTRAQLRQGETVLVQGAGGGIGTSTLRLAKALGAGRVIAVVSTEAKAEVARAAGADDVVLAEGWLPEVKRLTDGGVDIVIDPVGGDRFTDNLRSLTVGGRVIVLGFTGGEIPTVKVNRLLLSNIDVRGGGWGAWFATHEGYFAEQYAELGPLYASGAIAPPEPTVYPLGEAGAAIASLENRTAVGKVVVTLR